MTEGPIMNRRDLIGAAGAITVALGGPAAAAATSSRKAAKSPLIDFADREIAAAASAAMRAPAVRYAIDRTLGEQAYGISGSPTALTITAGDATGAMYGGLDVAEALRLGPDTMAALLRERIRKPYVARRGIKFNIPLDLRTPSYSDGSTSARANIPEVWTHDFWAPFLDEMARHRYNVLSLWNLHPFPSMVKVPEFPDVALDDVWRSKEPLGPQIFDPRGRNAVPPRYLANHEVVKTITIDQKIAFWRDVMQMAHDRGIEVYVFTWNLFVYGTDGKYGIDDAMSNRKTIAYTRASVRELVKTYPLLTGIGITAGENLPDDTPGVTQEQWLWQTYGEGVRDALKSEPSREVKLIHRFHETSGNEIEENWRKYPGYPKTFTFSYKYSVAHMYSSVNPPFIAEAMPFVTPELKTWLTVRNDDIYSFRWGDPDFARDYVLNMPAADRLAGFYMGPDGFIWGRDFLDRETAGASLGAARPLVMQKQWYSFLMWGRLSYDPTLPDAHFEALLRARFPRSDAAKLYAASCAASKIVPQVTRFFWKDIDIDWLPEACAYVNRKTMLPSFYTVVDFLRGGTMPATGILSVRRWRYKLAKGTAMNAITPLDCADALDGYADTTLRLVADLRGQAAPGGTAELSQTLGDFEAMAHLGHYFAAKIRGACDLALYDESGRRDQQTDAVGHMIRALQAWKDYAAIRDSQYLPNFFNRIGAVNVTEWTAKAAADVEIIRKWKPGTVRFDPKAPEAPEYKWYKVLPSSTLNV